MQSSARPAPSRVVVVAVASIELLAICVWAGGLVALGAVAAPLVFGIVPTPTSADAMTAVFLRFDRVAMTCAAIALVCEATFAVRGGKTSGQDVVRGAVVVLTAALAIGQGAWLSPGIAELHRGGAIRGLGDAGLALERLHRLSETVGKSELALLFVAVVLVVAKVSRASTPPT